MSDGSDLPILKGVAIYAGVVDRQGDMVTAEALEKARESWEKLKGTTVHHAFDLTRPVGIIRAVELERDGLHVTVELKRPLPSPKDYRIRVAFRAKRLHMEGEVQVVDEMELRWLSIVPKEDAP